MSFQSFSYFAFLPVAAFLYLKVCPARFQNGLLLAASVLFYWANRPTGADWPAAWPLVPLAVLAAVCLFVWRAALALARREKGQRGRLLAAAVVALLAVLAVFKYFNFLLPVLPLALILLGGTRTFAVRRSVARPAVMATVCLTSLVLLQGAGLYAQWQMT